MLFDYYRLAEDPFGSRWIFAFSIYANNRQVLYLQKQETDEQEL